MSATFLFFLFGPNKDGFIHRMEPNFIAGTGIRRSVIRKYDHEIIDLPPSVLFGHHGNTRFFSVAASAIAAAMEPRLLTQKAGLATIAA